MKWFDFPAISPGSLGDFADIAFGDSRSVAYIKRVVVG
jgi:hypothetical protein